MPSSCESALRAVRLALDRHGLLLEVDARRPSVTTIVAGEPVRGSWWAHRDGRLIFSVLGSLDDDEALVVPLVDRKATLVHPRLWPALYAVATSGEPWQTDGLSAPARRLLSAVRTNDEVRADRASNGRRTDPKAMGDRMRGLERRLLVRGTSVHTETGAHAAVVEGWDRWARRVGVGTRCPSPSEAKTTLEGAVSAWAAGTKPLPRLPWRSHRATP
jgi:hypothetical protein